jgi:pimeloyl-ACP methyl ester carboxylesterase
MSDAGRRRTGYIEANGTRLYYELMGEGHPLVLLHGGYMDTKMWDDQFTVFAEDYQVLRYDIRGHGKSGSPQLPYADYQDLYALLTSLGSEKTYLLGLSLGGLIAVDFTLEHPDLVDALVLVGAPVSGFPVELIYPTEELLQQEIQRRTPFSEAMRARDIPAMVEALMEDATLVPSPRYAAARERVREHLSSYLFAYFLDPAPRQEPVASAYERLADIHVPTLLIVGAEDHFHLHRIAETLEERIIGAKRVLISETHHMPNMEKPEAFNRIVLNFLKAL